MTPPMAGCRIFGVDFSGAKKAGKKIWLAEGYPSAAGLVVDDCRAAVDRLGCGSAPDTCLPALVEFIGEQRDAAFGCDFPFSLPAYLVDTGSWSDFVLAFPKRHATPEDFRKWCVEATRRQTGGERKECRRRTDQEAGTPWAAWNRRLFKQTYYGIGYLLFPLVRDRRAAVLPWHAATDDRPWVLETCPASTLKAEGLYLRYKRKDPERTGNRLRILRELVRRGLLASLPPAIARIATEDPGGDALDSIVAAIAAHRALTNTTASTGPANEVEALEGRVYV